ncbi:hypothetical protein ACQZV8_06950 [Magnetococcales bacterium HHB-1]
MALSVSTNIAAVAAITRQSSTTQKTFGQTLSRLSSSGVQVNGVPEVTASSDKDEGSKDLSLASQLSSQIRGLNQAEKQPAPDASINQIVKEGTLNAAIPPESGFSIMA